MTEQICLFSGPQQGIEEAVRVTSPTLNTDPAFGFDDQGVPEQVKNLVRRRSGLEDHTNFSLIKRAVQGYHQVEVPEILGVPQEVLQQLNTTDILSLYIGIETLKGRFLQLDETLIGQPFGKLLPTLVATGYQSTPQEAANAIREMKRMNVGYTGHSNTPSLEERMTVLTEDVKIAFLRAFYTPRKFSQEIRHEGADFFDEVYAAHQRTNGQPIDSNQSRDQYVAVFIELMRKKQPRGNDFDAASFQGRIVPSETEKGREYFVQRKVTLIPAMVIAGTEKGGKEIERYDCSCPHGYRAMYEQAVRGDECKHLVNFKKE